MILIQNGRVLDPVTNTDQVMDVLLDESGIVKTGEHLEAEGADVIDASGLVVAPGLMDAHVHFRDPGLTYKEDIFTGAAAAARGGFTTVVCMANTKPTVDNVETLNLVQKKGEKALIHVLQAAASWIPGFHTAGACRPHRVRICMAAGSQRIAASYGTAFFPSGYGE